MVERWVAVEGFEGSYSVSDLGRVMSHARLVKASETAGGARMVRERILRSRPDKDGYLLVNLCGREKPVTAKISALVANAFIGPNPGGLDVCHNDGRPANNHWRNLRYDTRSGNLADMHLHGTDRRGEKHPLAKLKKEQVLQIRSDPRRDGVIAEEFKVSPWTISDIKRHINWKDVS